MDLVLEISSNQQDEAWHYCRTYSAGSRFQAYINKLSLAILPTFEETLRIKATTTSCWELINGTAISIDQTRIVLIPSHAIDTTEIRVPIEWVDIPNWAADYYLAIQVNPEDGWLKIWGYTTHLELKTKGSFNGRDRTYSLDQKDLTHDISVLWVSRELCPEAPTRSEIEPLSTLATSEAIDLIERLANRSIAFPRRAIPFSLWGALLSNDEYRQRLIESRQQR